MIIFEIFRFFLLVSMLVCCLWLRFLILLVFLIVMMFILQVLVLVLMKMKGCFLMLYFLYFLWIFDSSEDMLLVSVLVLVFFWKLMLLILVKSGLSIQGLILIILENFFIILLQVVKWLFLWCSVQFVCSGGRMFCLCSFFSIEGMLLERLLLSSIVQGLKFFRFKWWLLVECFSGFSVMWVLLGSLICCGFVVFWVSVFRCMFSLVWWKICIRWLMFCRQKVLLGWVFGISSRLCVFGQYFLMVVMVVCIVSGSIFGERLLKFFGNRLVLIGVSLKLVLCRFIE